MYGEVEQTLPYPGSAQLGSVLEVLEGEEGHDSEEGLKGRKPHHFREQSNRIHQEQWQQHTTATGRSS